MTHAETIAKIMVMLCFVSILVAFSMTSPIGSNPNIIPIVTTVLAVVKDAALSLTTATTACALLSVMEPPSPIKRVVGIGLTVFL